MLNALADPPARGARETNRLEACSDGVFAIGICLWLWILSGLASRVTVPVAAAAPAA